MNYVNSWIYYASMHERELFGQKFKHGLKIF